MNARSRWFDVALAAVMLVACEIEVVTDTVRDNGHHHWPLAANVLIVVGLTVPLAWRRRTPLVSLVVVKTSVLLLTSALADVTSVNFPQLVLFIAPYSVAAYSTRRIALLGLGYDLLTTATVNVVNPSGATSWVFSLAVAIGAWSVGRALRARREMTAELERTAQLLISEQNDRELLAIAEERTRIARELQTLIADSVSSMIVQTQTAQRLLAERPGEADAAMSSIEDVGRQALADMRRVLGVLRHPTDDAELAPQPGVGQIGALIEHERSAGRAVTLHVDGTPGPMPASVDLGVYRILEEALSTYAAGTTAVDIVLRFGAGDVALTLTSEAVAPLDWPTPAMRERAALCGGSAAVEAAAGHGERLVVRLPCLFDEAVA